MLPKSFLPLLFVFLSCLSVESQAQQNFVKGYFVTTQNDTIRCFINDKNWQKNPKAIQYRITENGETDTFKPIQIKSFGLTTGDVYESHKVTLDGSTKDAEKLSLNGTSTATADTVFLRVLVKGAANLLYLQTKEREHFFYQAPGTQPVELTMSYTYQEDPTTGRRLLISKPIFKGQLKVYFGDCPELSNKMATTPYSLSALRLVFKQYNACRNNENYVSTEERIAVKFTPVLGSSLHKLSFTSAERYDLEKSNFVSSPALNLGFAIEAILPRNRQRWSFYNEVLLKSYQAKGEYTHSTEFTHVSRQYNTEFKVTSVGLASMFRYRIQMGSLRPFIGLGMTNTLNTSMKDHQTVHETYYPSGERTIERSALGFYKKYEIGATLGAGIRTKRWTVEARGEYSDGFVVHAAVSSTKASVSVLLGYTIN